MTWDMVIWSAGLVFCAAGLFLAHRLHTLGSSPVPPLPKTVSVIIPARNEAHNLPTLLRSLGLQSVRPQKVIVVDDASEDRTAEQARQLGARVVVSTPLPEGWRGKTWACHQGAQMATGDWFLFVDADIWFEPEGLARILSDYSGGAFSVGPYHAIRKRFSSSPKPSKY